MRDSASCPSGEKALQIVLPFVGALLAFLLMITIPLMIGRHCVHSSCALRSIASSSPSWPIHHYAG